MAPAFTVRHPTLDDVPAILAVIHASDIAAVGEPDFTADEVREVLTAPNHDPARDSWVAVEPDGRVISWAFIDNPSASARELLDVYAHPEHGRHAQGPLLDLVVERAAERGRASGHREITLRTGAIASEKHWIALLENAGFGFVKRYARMSRPLTGAEQPPAIPAGITVRTVGPDDLRDVYAVIEAAFADLPDRMEGDFDAYRATVEALPSVSWDEWFVAEVDGRVVGALQSADQGAEDNEGWVKNLGVLDAHRGRGIGRLLLQTAFAAYARKGRAKAGLGVDMTNPTAAYRLYEGVGLRPVYEADVYERRLTL